MSSTLGLVNLDEFNVKKIYPDSRINPQHISLPMKVNLIQSADYASYILSRIEVNDRLVASVNEDNINIDYWMLDLNNKGSLVFHTLAGIPKDPDCDTTISTYASREYIYDRLDWKNAEGTIFIKPSQLIAANASLEIKIRSGFHPPYKCPQGSGYICKFFLASDLVELIREVYHSMKVSKYQTTQSVKSFLNNWVGLKFIVYNMLVRGAVQVALELWICPSDLEEEIRSNWIKVFRQIDFTGSGWSKGALNAGADYDDQALTYGGPRAIFNWSGVGKMFFKYVSWREIDYKTGFRTGGDSGGRRPVIFSCPPGQHYDQASGTCVVDT